MNEWMQKGTNEKGEKVEQTEWHKVVAWGKTAEIIEKYVTKGKEIAIEGKLTHRSYDDKNGEKRYITEVVANEVLLLGKQFNRIYYKKMPSQSEGICVFN